MCTTHRFTDMQARKASQSGGLDHHVMVCSCGFEAASTMPSLVTQYAREHLAYFSPEAVMARELRSQRAFLRSQRLQVSA